MFEQEYNDVIQNLQYKIGEDDYIKYLQSIDAKKTHAGYFSIDKKGHMINSKVRYSDSTAGGDESGKENHFLDRGEQIYNPDEI